MRHVVISEDQRILRDTAERFLRDHYTFRHREAIRHSSEGFSDKVWRQFAEMGWLALPFDVELGGIGGTMLDVALLMEIFGPALVAEPFGSTIAAGMAIMLGGTDNVRRSLIPQLCEGRLRLALAFAERYSGYACNTPSTSAARDSSGYSIHGAKAVVLGAPLAHKFIVSARIADDDGFSLFVIPADSPGLSMRAYATIDGQRAADIALNNVHVGVDALLGVQGAGDAILRRAIDAGTVANLGEAAGLLQAAVDVTGQYLNTREQFGRKLASFQALRHRMARMYIGKEEVRALCRQAAAAFADDPDSVDSRETISAAKVHAGRIGRHVCEEAIQLHGAIAISDEYIVGHFLKRLVTIDHMYGNANHHFDVYVNTTRSLAAAS